MKYCKFCKKEIDDKADYCPDCADLHNTNSEYLSLSQQSENNQNHHEMSQNHNGRSTKSQFSLAITAIIFVVITAAVVTAFFLIHNVFGDESKEQTNTVFSSNMSSEPTANPVLNSSEHISNYGYQLLIGPDGQYYFVDSDGNSLPYPPASVQTTITGSSSVYNSTSTQSGNSTAIPTIPVTPPTTPPTNHSIVPPPTSPPTSSNTVASIYTQLAVNRRFGFNKASNSSLPNTYLDTIRVYFTYNNKDWLIEFWKGEYAMASVGCEIGLYCNNNPSSPKNGPLDASIGENKQFKAVDDKDAMYCSMELWQYIKPSDAEPVKRIDFGRRRCWWAAAFEDAVLDKHSDRTTLVMRGSIEFPTTEMMELFLNALEERGFKERSTSTYKNYECYSVNGKKVTVNWRYYDEDRFQSQ